eukprot:gene10529-19297_t
MFKDEVWSEEKIRNGLTAERRAYIFSESTYGSFPFFLQQLLA